MLSAHSITLAYRAAAKLVNPRVKRNRISTSGPEKPLMLHIERYGLYVIVEAFLFISEDCRTSAQCSQQSIDLGGRNEGAGARNLVLFTGMAVSIHDYSTAISRSRKAFDDMDDY